MGNESNICGNGNAFVVTNGVLKEYGGHEESVRLPGFICAVGKLAFVGNETIKTVYLSSNVTLIDENAFYGCKALEKAVLPYAINNIRDFAFKGCGALSQIVFNGDKERWLCVQKGESWLDGTPDFIIVCNDGCITKQEEIGLEREAQTNFSYLKNDFVSDDSESNSEPEEDMVFIDYGNPTEFRERRRKMTEEQILKLQAQTRGEDLRSRSETMDKPNEEKLQNAHIRIDHYSWPKNSIYRVFEKEYINSRGFAKVDELMRSDNPEDKIKVRRIIYFLRVDPSDLPKHPSWEDKEFEEQALRTLFEIIKTDGAIRQSTARRLARSARAKAKARKDKKLTELYDRIIFELTEADEREFQALKEEVSGGNL